MIYYGSIAEIAEARKRLLHRRGVAVQNVERESRAKISAVEDALRADEARAEADFASIRAEADKKEMADLHKAVGRLEQELKAQNAQLQSAGKRCGWRPRERHEKKEMTDLHKAVGRLERELTDQRAQLDAITAHHARLWSKVSYALDARRKRAKQDIKDLRINRNYEIMVIKEDYKVDLRRLRAGILP